MGTCRSIRRKKELEERKKIRKKSQDKLNTVSRVLDSMPMKCDECDIPFDKTDIESHSSWRIAVHDSGKVDLLCPQCGKH